MRTQSSAWLAMKASSLGCSRRFKESLPARSSMLSSSTGLDIMVDLIKDLHHATNQQMVLGYDTRPGTSQSGSARWGRIYSFKAPWQPEILRLLLATVLPQAVTFVHRITPMRKR